MGRFSNHKARLHHVDQAPLIKTKQTMKTEIDTLKTAWRDYANAKSIEEFNAAEKVLLKFHNKYGTIDIPTIKSLIQ